MGPMLREKGLHYWSTTTSLSSFIHLSLFNSLSTLLLFLPSSLFLFLLTSSTSFPRCRVQITTPAWPFLSPSSLPFSTVLGLWLMTSTLHWTADYIELVVEQRIKPTHIWAHKQTRTYKTTNTLRKGITQNIAGCRSIKITLSGSGACQCFSKTPIKEGKIE